MRAPGVCRTSLVPIPVVRELQLTAQLGSDAGSPPPEASMEESILHPYYVCDSKTGRKEGYSTLDSAREALLGWILLQRQAGEVVVETDSGQWHDSRVTRWIADREDKIVGVGPS